MGILTTKQFEQTGKAVLGRLEVLKMGINVAKGNVPRATVLKVKLTVITVEVNVLEVRMNMLKVRTSVLKVSVTCSMFG